LVILQKKVAALSQASLERFVVEAARAVGLQGRVDVLIAGSSALRGLNRRFRGKDKATDVLSFPWPEPWLRNHQDRGAYVGDIAISADIATQNAARLGHSAVEEVKILALHGILHLAGFDHERDNGQMARKETKLRQQLGLPDALIQRSQPAEGKPSKKGRGRTRAASGRRTA
jgi:probable rRNA maturation factor